MRCLCVVRSVRCCHLCMPALSHSHSEQLQHGSEQGLPRLPFKTTASSCAPSPWLPLFCASFLKLHFKAVLWTESHSTRFSGSGCSPHHASQGAGSSSLCVGESASGCLGPELVYCPPVRDTPVVSHFGAITYTATMAIHVSVLCDKGVPLSRDSIHRGPSVHIPR